MKNFFLLILCSCLVAGFIGIILIGVLWNNMFIKVIKGRIIGLRIKKSSFLYADFYPSDSLSRTPITGVGVEVKEYFAFIEDSEGKKYRIIISRDSYEELKEKKKILTLLKESVSFYYKRYLMVEIFDHLEFQN